MLFINFLCLLYLMVLINCHTISKSVNKEDKYDDVFDSLNDIEYTTQHKIKHERFLNTYRREKPFKTTTRESKINVDDETVQTTTEKHFKPIHQTSKRRAGGFWRKFKIKKKVHYANREKRFRHNNKVVNTKQASLFDVSKSDKSKLDKKRRRNTHQFVLEKKKREVTTRDTSSFMKPKVPNEYISNKDIYIPHRESNKSKQNLSKTKSYQTNSNKDDIKTELSTMTTKIAQLKQLYSIDNFKASSTPVVYYKTMKTYSPKIKPFSDTEITTEKSEFSGTAQIEALLNDIKEKAVLMVAEQNPSVTDIISNTVNEATFEADPILTHLEISSPGYALNTFVAISNIIFDKRTVNTTKSSHPDKTSQVTSTESPNIAARVITTDNISVAQTTEQINQGQLKYHKIVGRSIKEDAMTTVQNVEDILQKELKHVYKKIKSKLSSDFRKEVYKTKCTLKKKICKIANTITHGTKAPVVQSHAKSHSLKSHVTHKPASHFDVAIPTPRHGRADLKINPEKLKKVTTHNMFTGPATVIDDDYAMLTLFKEILSKTHEENIMKMLSTRGNLGRYKRNRGLLTSKRNLETLSGLSLKENVKIYDDGEEIPEDMIYNIDITIPDILSNESTDRKNEAVTTKYQSYEKNVSQATDQPFEDISYEGLSNKLSYNEYINGYKHYLNFQREQANQNFSNMVKYQAHRHHSVDDIGKYILNKIPPLSSRKKRFFDENDLDDQDVSTKSDDSWFKKHFYMFIDNSPPKKFHTSQTVSLKSPMSDDENSGVFTENSNKPESKHNVKNISEGDHSLEGKEEVNLEELSRALDENKGANSNIPAQEISSQNNFEAATISNDNTENIFKGFRPQYLIDKLFGKGRRTVKAGNNIENYNDEFEIPKKSVQNKFKRNARKHGVRKINFHIQKECNTTSKTSKINKDDDIRKNGYVGINIVPQVTNTVQHKDPKQKRNLFKDILEKLHLIKKHKNIPVKVKREYQRIQRFNPLKKLRDIFKSRPEEKVLKPNFYIPDFDMMTSHIDTFKAVKYDTVPSPEEMRQQIPNISDDDNIDIGKIAKQFSHSTDTPSLTTVGTLWGGSVAMDNAFYDSLDDWQRDLNASTEIFPETMTPPVTQTRPAPRKLTTSKLKQLADKSEMNDDIPSVNLKATKKISGTMTSFSPQVMSLSDMKNEIDKMQNKLTVKDNIGYDQMFTGKSTLKPNLKKSSVHRYNMTRHNAITMNKDNVITPMAHNYYHFKLFTNKPKQFHKSSMSRNHLLNQNDHGHKDKNLTIEAKMKPIETHFKTKYYDFGMEAVLETPQIHEFSDNDKYLNLHNSHDVKKDSTKVNTYDPFLTIHITSKKKYSTDAKEEDLKLVNSKTYPDYFNDLLMWNNDLLNSNGVPKQWQDILKDMNNTSLYTTQSMEKLQKELMDMNDFKNYDLSHLKNNIYADTKVADRDTDLSNHKKTKGTRNVGGHSKANSDKEIVIEEEAKYVYFNLQPKKADRSLKAVDFINNLNELNRKTSSFKSNKKEEEGEDWEKNIEYKSSEDPPVILVDTTLLSYDDDVESITASLAPRILSKNSLKTVDNKNVNVAAVQAITQTNKQPLQYFSTPLPMKMYEFEKFLKENRLDVESVTSPLVDLPSINNLNFKKDPGKIKQTQIKDRTTKKEKNINKTEFTKDTVEIRTDFTKHDMPKEKKPSTINIALENQMEYLEALENDLLKDYNYEGFKRFRRFNKFSDNVNNSAKYKVNKSKYDKLKKKMKLFQKKTTEYNDYNQNHNYQNYNSLMVDQIMDLPQKDVEVTIINFDDTGKKLIENMKTVTESASDTQMKLSKNKDSSKNITTRSSTLITGALDLINIEKGAKENDFLHKLHNNLLYSRMFNRKHTKISEPSNNSLIETDPLPVPKELLNKIPFRGSNLPKRVRISSNNYKYDIIYRHPDKVTLERDYPGTLTGPLFDDSTEPMKTAEYLNDENLYENSEFNKILQVIEVVQSVENYTRPNVLIHIDLPTFYIPNNNITEPVTVPTTKSWSDLLLRYLSGIALVEMLNKSGIMKAIDGITSVDGLAKNFNAIKNFSGDMEENVKRGEKTRFVRKAGTTENASAKESQGSRISKNNRLGKLLQLLTSSKITAVTATKEIQDLLAYDLDAGPTIKSDNHNLHKEFTRENTGITSSKNQDLHTYGLSEEEETPQRNKLSQLLENIKKKLTFAKIKSTTKTATTKRTVQTTKSTTKTTTSVAAEHKTGSKIEAEDKKRDERDESFMSEDADNGDNEYEELISASTALHKLTANIMLLTTPAMVDKGKGNKVRTPIGESVYVDPGIYEDQIYYEFGTGSKSTNVNNNTAKYTNMNKVKDTINKRDIQNQDTYTAKDVAALEVIVDLMKNTLGYEETEPPNVFLQNELQINQPNNYTKVPVFPGKANGLTNSIQVHIAIPYEEQNSKKRSLEPVRVRKIFSAKMSTPVDMEYQVHSFESTMQPTHKITDLNNALSPGVYLLVDNSNLPKGLALKPIRSNLANLKIREAATNTVTQKMVTTSSSKSFAKVTLSKDFVAAINKHLVQLYENLTSYTKSEHDIEIRKINGSDNQRNKRNINWEAVKKYFGHDRVCNCKCKVNKTMCKACAASDSVVSELIFELDNLAKYMNDHCTELQTYFWMNPSGGRKLRDSVHKIDKSLSDYYKRVKGKCRGRTCKTFSTYIDKREFSNGVETKEASISPSFVKYMESMAIDIDEASKIVTFFDGKLNQVRDKLVQAINTCISPKSFEKRSNLNKTRTQKMVKNVYSLDNVNVNIICNADTSTLSYNNFEKPIVVNTEIPRADFETHDVWDFDVGDLKRSHKIRKGIKKYFSFTRNNNKDKLFSYYTKTIPPKLEKREVKNVQIESPLIADTGGSFWYDYINKGKVESRIVREPKKSYTPEVKVAIVRSKNIEKATTKNISTNSDDLKKTVHPSILYMTVTTSKHLVERNDNEVEDSLTNNINQLLKLLSNGNSFENAITECNDNAKTKSTKHKQKIKKVKTKKAKLKKTNKAYKSYKAKNIKQNNNFTKTKNNDENTTDTTTKINTNPSDETLSKTTSNKLNKLNQDLRSVTKAPTSQEIASNKAQNSDILSRPRVESTTNINTSTKAKGTKLETNPNNVNYTTSPNYESNQSEELVTKASPLHEIKSIPQKANTSKEYNNESPSYSNSESKITTKTKKHGFLKKLRMVTLHFINNLDKHYFTAEENHDKTTEVAKDSKYFTDDADSLLPSTNILSDVTTQANPTILIVNDYDNVYNEQKDLLLSIIDHETNRLNQEWQKYAYDRSQSDKVTSDNKIIDSDPNVSSPRQTKSKEPKATTHCKETNLHLEDTVTESNVLKGVESSKPPEPSELPKLTNGGGLLKKIVNKFGVKLVHGAQQKVVTDLNNVTEKTPKRARKKMTVKKLRHSTLINDINAITDKYDNLKEAATLPPKHYLDSIRKNKENKNNEICDVASENHCLCDLQATYEHIQNLYNRLTKAAFENYVKNITCYKFKRAPDFLYIERLDNKKRVRKSRSNIKSWDWIRKKRSAPIIDDNHKKLHRRNYDSNQNTIYSHTNRFEFEKFFKGFDGIYRIKKRSKRNAGLKNIVNELRNLPPLVPAINELYAMLGDTVTLKCSNESKARDSAQTGQYIWKTDRHGMLYFDNVLVDGAAVIINGVQTRNGGHYVCSQGGNIKRDLKVSVITLPIINVVFSPVYSVDAKCGYNDLKAVKFLSVPMSELGCSNQCKIEYNDPVCLKDTSDGETKIRATAVLTVSAPRLRGGAPGRRDAGAPGPRAARAPGPRAARAALAALCASNVPVLTSIPVVLHNNGSNKTLTPSRAHRSPVTTHTLKKKKSSCAQIRRPYSDMSSSDMHVVMTCPAGYYLLPDVKICASCPANTYSSEGDNTCAACPHGSEATPGAARCRQLRIQPRRYDWWWYPPCGYLVACGMVLCCCGVCVAFSLTVHTISRNCCPEARDRTQRLEVAAAPPRAPRRLPPTSPSRVILAKFFRSSLTSSKASDSQETKFELWKERNIPPPPPPIDFDA